MVIEAKGRIFIEGKNQDRYLLYLLKHLAEDTMFPFKGEDSIFVKVSFRSKDDKLLVEKWVEPEELK
jgi:hypothetical protein